MKEYKDKFQATLTTIKDTKAKFGIKQDHDDEDEDAAKGGHKTFYIDTINDYQIQGWAKEWSLGWQFVSSCLLCHRLPAGCVAT